MDNWLKNNNVVKALSILLAVMLWMVVSMDTNTTPNISAPIEPIKNTYLYETQIIPKYNDNQYIVNLSTKQVNVSLRGSNFLLNQFQNQDNIDKVRFFVDLTNYKEGKYTVPIKYTGFPEGIEVNIEPDTILVEVDAKQRVEMDVLGDKLGKVSEGYQAGEPIIKPKKVHVTGSKEQIDKVAFVKAFVNIEGAKEPITKQVPLKAMDKNGNVLDLDITPQTAEVSIPVTSPFITLPITYQIENFPPAGYAIESIDLLTEKITVYGPKEVLTGYEVYPGPNIDLSNFTKSKTIQISIPVIAGIIKTEPDYLELKIDIVKSEVKTFNDVPIEINGLNDGLKATIISPENGVNMTIEGAPKRIEELSLNDLQVFLDLTNIPVGEHELPIQYNIPINTKIVQEDKRAKVIVTKE